MQYLRTILHRSSEALHLINEMPINPNLGAIRVHLETIQALTIDVLRQNDLAEDREENEKLYRRP